MLVSGLPLLAGSRSGGRRGPLPRPRIGPTGPLNTAAVGSLETAHILSLPTSSSCLPRSSPEGAGGRGESILAVDYPSSAHDCTFPADSRRVWRSSLGGHMTVELLRERRW
ncbi:hypothetical protein COCON_G00080950 [Conger conger]|uniref:Uncharacterized protein n=1 Tax=Conger conger TaxID=82655 RepID=A0A9Q1DPL7_CONCO|nr:hypothetical protein COCON_G00080950 [Conger conger]